MNREGLCKIAEEINKELGATIKINTKSTGSGLIAAITEAVESFEGKASLLKSTIDFLCEKEIDVPASIKEKSKTASPKKEAKPKKDKGPGVIATIEKAVRESCKEQPVSREKILSILKKAFPEKEETSMMNTIKVQLPGRMAKEKNLKIKTTEDGKFYV